jgi:hypothetical protein
VKVPVRIPLALIEHDMAEKSEGESGDSEISPGHVAAPAIAR